jgi:methyl-accepting chemotaxis protein
MTLSSSLPPWARRRASDAVQGRTADDLESIDAALRALVQRRVEASGSSEPAEVVSARVLSALTARGRAGGPARSRARQVGDGEHAAEQAVTETVALSAASARVSRSFEQVVRVVEDVRASTSELARGTSSAAEVAGTAVQRADAADGRLRELQQAGDQIGETVRLITAITAQSRTLALNATIEAARAGEAGRGFAVVASEVKVLAEQTAQAARQIGDRIQAVQSGTGHAVAALEEVRTAITQVHGIQEVMAAAVAEQGAQAAAIVDSCTEASRGSAAIAASVARLTEVQRRAFVAAALATAQAHVDRAGPVELGGQQVTWQAVDQVTGIARQVQLPQLVVGGTWLGVVTDPAQHAPVVDDVVRAAGGLCTIFQRMDAGAGGGLLRVATTVVTAEGRRAVGTYLSRSGPDGAPNPVVQAVLGGDTYYGEAVVVGRRCATAYAPLLDEAGDVVGAIFVGIPAEH